MTTTEEFTSGIVDREEGTKNESVCQMIIDLEQYLSPFDSPNPAKLNNVLTQSAQPEFGESHGPPSLRLVTDSKQETPKAKKHGFFAQPVRRRLVFPEPDEGSAEISRNEQHYQTILKLKCSPSQEKVEKENIENLPKRKYKRNINGARPSRKSANQGSAKENQAEQSLNQIQPPPQPALEKIVPFSTGTDRKIAQLVVWTKSNGNLKENFEEKTVQQEAKPKPVEVEQPEASSKLEEPGPLKGSNVEGDLFFVQYPVRPAYEVSKNKVKVQKRQRALTPTPPRKKKRKSKGKSKRSSKQLNPESSSSSGRAYTYLHACLENHPQNIAVTASDFRVDTLLQPEQGPIEIPSKSIEIETQEFFEALLPVSESGVVFTDSGENIILSISSDPKLSEIVSVPQKESSKLESTKEVSDDLCTPPSTADDPEVWKKKSSEKKEAICDTLSQKAIVEGAVENRETPSSPFTTLPDQFTVATPTAPNEFDLLIQNVVHEELVDGNGEDLSYESFAKKMKISTSNCSSNSNSKPCSQEGTTTMDEHGKPRCTYTELIEKALTETGGLTVSEIYTWISERYPFYRPDDDRWKNSVRHNLSINPYFKKGEKARSGAGHLWTISEESKGLRPSMVSWDKVSFGQDDRRKCPYDPSEFIMPMENETDRAVANILGRYVSECRASQEASNASKENKEEIKKNKEERSHELDTLGVVRGEVQLCTTSDTELPPVEQELENPTPNPEAREQQLETSSSGATCETATTEPPQFSVDELNPSHITIDLSTIALPEGTFNFDELMHNGISGRLVYIQTDLEANKENESAQAVILDDALLPELANLTSTGSAMPNNEDRYQSFYSDALGIDLGFGKSDTISNVSFPQDDILAAACAQLISDEVQQNDPHHQGLTSLDQVIPLSSYEASTSSSNVPALSESLLPMNAAALYESRELGLSYTYQAEPSGSDLL